ncbi:MAG: DoxX family protein [Blastocatellia bacterium]|nr:DoxX family protein [Blastocatellia bacterium]
MQPADQPTPKSNMLVWVGRIISALPVLLLLFGGGMTLNKPVQAVEEFTRLGYPDTVIVGIGIVLLVCTILYAIPYTAVLGAILLTGYLGGAVATHVRIGDPTSKVIIPVIVGMLIWGGLFLRDERLRKLLPLRR